MDRALGKPAVAADQGRALTLDGTFTVSPQERVAPLPNGCELAPTDAGRALAEPLSGGAATTEREGSDA